MITVEKVLKKNAVESTKVAQQNNELLSTGSVKEVKQSYWPWIFLASAAIFGGWYFLRKEGSGTNEGISG